MKQKNKSFKTKKIKKQIYRQMNKKKQKGGFFDKSYKKDYKKIKRGKLTAKEAGRLFALMF